MNWYMAKNVFRIVCGEGKHTPQFDEQLRLISADSRQEAFEKAQSVGLATQDSFLNHKQELVQWQFINTVELHKLSSLSDGAEIYSGVKETDHVGNFIDTVHKKADLIRSAFSVKEPELI